MIRRPPRSTLSSSSAASDVYKRQLQENSKEVEAGVGDPQWHRTACTRFRGLSQTFTELGKKTLRAEHDSTSVMSSGRHVELPPTSRRESLEYLSHIQGLRETCTDDAELERRIQEETLRDMQNLERSMNHIMEVLNDIAETVVLDQERFNEISDNVERVAQELDETMDDLEEAERFDARLKAQKRCVCYILVSLLFVAGVVLAIIGLSGGFK
eukprot:TRINITY_DN29783_c0_g1_i1.p1 TRINITY_DN29783_c0_g1~~TRINITY_DN29783_c0_g1_i1.p1  ORF type:complete len:213 (-),score=63.43 TRINITY_DN29783_c0_g1_i1:41-679(-)